MTSEHWAWWENVQQFSWVALLIKLLLLTEWALNSFYVQLPRIQVADMLLSTCELSSELLRAVVRCTPTHAGLNIFKCSATECLLKRKVVIYQEWLRKIGSIQGSWQARLAKWNACCSTCCVLESWFHSCWIVQQHLKLRVSRSTSYY